MLVKVNPLGSMDLLSQIEVDLLRNTANSELYQQFRNCSLAILKSGAKTDNSKKLLDMHKDFEIKVIQRERGVKLELSNPPQDAFVDGKLIKTIQINLFSVLRDIIFINSLLNSGGLLQQSHSENNYITNLVFMILRNATAFPTIEEPNLIVCWGGHSINRKEYKYARDVGFELGLRELNICTGCGPGAMEAPMRGAAAGHSQQRYLSGRFVGVTEPSIIAAEPPNPMVNELIIMPDIEKRLEAFVRLGHGIIILPGGVGTAEEFLYLLGILMAPENAKLKLPIILTGPATSANYFEALDDFIVHTIGEAARSYYRIVIDNPARVASLMKQAMPLVKQQRLERGDAYSFNWTLKINGNLQHEFIPTHANMSNLNLSYQQPPEQLAATLRQAFSGIVAGNVKQASIQAIKKHGVYQLHGDKQLMLSMDKLLTSFIKQGRMKLPGSTYKPCYKIQL